MYGNGRANESHEYLETVEPMKFKIKNDKADAMETIGGMYSIKINGRASEFQG